MARLFPWQQWSSQKRGTGLDTPAHAKKNHHNVIHTYTHTTMSYTRTHIPQCHTPVHTYHNVIHPYTHTTMSYTRTHIPQCHTHVHTYHNVIHTYTHTVSEGERSDSVPVRTEYCGARLRTVSTLS